MKKPLIQLSLLALASGSAIAAPFLAIGDNAELFLTGAAGIRFDDNITYAARNEIDDTIFQFVPGLNLRYGKNSLLKGEFSAQETIDRYSSNSNLNTELTSASGTASYDDGKLKLGFGVAFAELNQNTRDIRPSSSGSQLVRRDTSSLSGSIESRVTEKIAVGSGLSFAKTDYKAAGYTDSEEFSVPLNVYYSFRPKLDLSAGIRYRETDIAVGTDADTYYYNVGARGEFTPKLIGQFNIGLNKQKYDDGGSDEGLGFSGSFAYQYSPKTSINIGLSNDFSTSSSGESTKNTTFSIGASSELTTDWKASVGLSYNKVDYAGPRKDDYLEGTAGVSYILNSFISIAASYTYRDNDSNAAPFKNNVFSVAANLRY